VSSNEKIQHGNNLAGKKISRCCDCHEPSWEITYNLGEVVEKVSGIRYETYYVCNDCLENKRYWNKWIKSKKAL
tara:strand:+ start:582 stop:803 length:222 start_codon:yes stop_codon:yes gene_type:complete